MPTPIAKLLTELSAALLRLSLPWYVFGAQAVLVYGRPRLTEDVDVTVVLGDLAYTVLVDELASVGFALDPVATDEFVAATRVLPLVYERSGMALDVVLAGPGLEEIFVAEASVQNLGGVMVPVIRAEHLLVTKILAGRPKDLDDAEGVIRGLGDRLVVADVQQLLAEIETGLGRSDLLVKLDELLSRGA